MSARPRVVGFVDPRSGVWRELKDPDALASMRQLYRLNATGSLDVVEPGSVQPITVGEAAAAVADAASDNGEDYW
jgi:hypothetical protein